MRLEREMDRINWMDSRGVRRAPEVLLRLDLERLASQQLADHTAPTASRAASPPVNSMSAPTLPYESRAPEEYPGLSDSECGLRPFVSNH